MEVIRGHLGCPLSGGCPLFGGSAIGGSTVYYRGRGLQESLIVNHFEGDSWK